MMTKIVLSVTNTTYSVSSEVRVYVFSSSCATNAHKKNELTSPATIVAIIMNEIRYS